MRAKTFVAVGHETANKGEHGKNLRRDTMDANLLSNMELGIHADAAPGRQTSDMVWLCRCVPLTIRSAQQTGASGAAVGHPYSCCDGLDSAGHDVASSDDQQREALWRLNA